MLCGGRAGWLSWTGSWAARSWRSYTATYLGLVKGSAHLAARLVCWRLFRAVADWRFVCRLPAGYVARGHLFASQPAHICAVCEWQHAAGLLFVLAGDLAAPP